MSNYEDDSFTGNCPTCGQQFYMEAFETAKAFIDSHMGDPDTRSEIYGRYAKYQEALKKLEAKYK